jgi:anti-sigma regulatory factor (Ser/Thr protein kinase)
MRAPSDTAAGGTERSPEFIHELGLYGSDDEFRALICPFAFGGLEHGEPVVFAYDDHKVGLLREWLPDSPNITYVTDTGPYATPARALAAWRHVVQTHVAAGATRVRIAGNVPHEGYGRPYAGWDRYEAAVDRALGDLPVWAPCLYDMRLAPADVIETAKKLHRGFLDADGAHRPNHDFARPRGLADFRSPPPDPLERTSPTTVLVDPTPVAARAAVRALAHGLLDADATDALLIGVSEALTNARVHGVAPVLVHLWADDRQVLIRVQDQGNGPADSLVGLLPTPSDVGESGRGMWIVHNLDIDVALIAADDGFTVRLRACRRFAGA